MPSSDSWLSCCFFFNATATTEIYTLSLHDALPISTWLPMISRTCSWPPSRGCIPRPPAPGRSEEHTSELQSRRDLVCRLLLEKKKKKTKNRTTPNNTITKHNTHND